MIDMQFGGGVVGWELGGGDKGACLTNSSDWRKTLPDVPLESHRQIGGDYSL